MPKIIVGTGDYIDRNERRWAGLRCQFGPVFVGMLIGDLTAYKLVMSILLV